MEKITQEQRDKLRKPLPTEAVKQHPTKKFLSSIKAIYVVERLNDVFGIMQWNVKNEVIKDDGKWVIVKSLFTINGYDGEIEAFGGNDNADPGDAYKGACTDALTKIGSYLEIGIDVFKGLHDQKTEVKQEEDNRPWLTDPLLKKLIDRLGLEPVEEKAKTKQSAFSSFRMRKEQKDQITKA